MLDNKKNEKYCITFDDIKNAHNRIKEEVVHTPLYHFDNLSKLCNCNLYLKLENLQRCKAFKFRGALNKIKQLPKGSTVCAVSAGNHSQGVALASQLCGFDSVIYMPSTAMTTKVQATQGYGARVVQEGDSFDDCNAAMLRDLKKHDDWVFVPPFDDKDVIAGQGTIALEVLQDLPDADIVVIPVGGGGLLSGMAYALKMLNKNIRVIGVQMTSSPATFIKFTDHHGKNIDVPEHAQASPLGDGIAVKNPGKLNLDIIYDFVDEVVIVNEDEVALAISLMAERGKIISEGAGAVAFAAVLSHKFNFNENDKIVGIVSGGNIPLQMLTRCFDRSFFIRKTRAALSVTIPYGTKHFKELTNVIVENKAHIIEMKSDSQLNSYANNEHCTVIVDLASQSSLDDIQSIFNKKGWACTVQESEIIDK